MPSNARLETKYYIVEYNKRRGVEHFSLQPINLVHVVVVMMVVVVLVVTVVVVVVVVVVVILAAAVEVLVEVM